jgi:hypothetical protein
LVRAVLRVLSRRPGGQRTDHSDDPHPSNPTPRHTHERPLGHGSPGRPGLRSPGRLGR